MSVGTSWSEVLAGRRLPQGDADREEREDRVWACQAQADRLPGCQCLHRRPSDGKRFFDKIGAGRHHLGRRVKGQRPALALVNIGRESGTDGITSEPPYEGIVEESHPVAGSNRLSPPRRREDGPSQRDRSVPRDLQSDATRSLRAAVFPIESSKSAERAFLPAAKSA